MTFADKAVNFFRELDFKGSLPDGIQVMNPFRDNPLILPLIGQFYRKFYNDERQRHIILGINPGRFGAGSTGIPFTDTARLSEKCGLTIAGLKTYEPSSAFIYEMIDAYGGTELFYSDFYISAVSPLGFTRPGRNGKHVNYNYYDSRELTEALKGFIRQTLEKQLQFGIIKDVCFCIGSGKNLKFISELNRAQGYFGRIVALDHPRFVMQYKAKQKQLYIAKYVEELRKVTTKKM